MTRKIECPVCEEKIEVEDYMDEGDVVECPECYAELEIISLRPLQVREHQEEVEFDDRESDNDW